MRANLATFHAATYRQQQQVDAMWRLNMQSVDEMALWVQRNTEWLARYGDALDAGTIASTQAEIKRDAADYLCALRRAHEAEMEMERLGMAYQPQLPTHGEW